MFYWDKPQFYGVKTQASNVAQSRGDYTADMFKEDFPQFFDTYGVCLLPDTIQKSSSVRQAPLSSRISGWMAGAMPPGLYVAHYATLYLRTYAEHSSTPSQAAGTGALVGVVESATLGDATVKYDADALTKATEGWGDLNATQYGQMLASKARLVGMAGSYVI